MNRPIEKIWLPEVLLDEMTVLATCAHPNETGGVLIGYDAGNGVVVTAIIGPGSKAIHGLRAFIPDYTYQDSEIERIYRESGRRHTYLGDWHSHPDGRATLSSRDKRTLRGIASHRPARVPAPIMGILADGDCWRLAVWRCFPRDMRARRFFSRYDRMALIQTRGDWMTLDVAGVSE